MPTLSIPAIRGSIVAATMTTLLMRVRSTSASVMVMCTASAVFVQCYYLNKNINVIIKTDKFVNRKFLCKVIFKILTNRIGML